MYSLSYLIEDAPKCAAYINGHYVPSRPIPWGFGIWRIKDAWAVLTGKADAVFWPEGQ